MDSPLYAVVTSCSTRRACSPVGQSTEYASWGQATICQIRPIGHVRCAVYSVFSGVGRVSHACEPGWGKFNMHRRTFVSRLERANETTKRTWWRHRFRGPTKLTTFTEKTIAVRACIIYFLGYSITKGFAIRLERNVWGMRIVQDVA